MGIDAEIAAFREAAQQFCMLVDNARACSRAELLVATRDRLLALYAAATRLPVVEPVERIELGPRPQPPPLAGFEELDVYWEVFDPYAESAPVAGSLADDLLDIYRELQPGLARWDDGHGATADASRAAAVWAWRFGFDTHWGDHAIDALRALHHACKRA